MVFVDSTRAGLLRSEVEKGPDRPRLLLVLRFSLPLVEETASLDGRERRGGRLWLL